MDDEGLIAGIISADDLAKAHSDNIKVEDLMTNKVHVILKNTRVKDAANVMLKHHVHHLVVMEEGKILGMISSLDIIGALLED